MNSYVTIPTTNVGYANRKILFISTCPNGEVILTSIEKRLDYGYMLNIDNKPYWITDEDYERIMKELN